MYGLYFWKVNTCKYINVNYIHQALALMKLCFYLKMLHRLNGSALVRPVGLIIKIVRNKSSTIWLLFNEWIKDLLRFC